MTHSLDFLTDADVRQIRLLIEALEHSTFDYLQLEVGEIKLTLGRGAMPAADSGAAARAAVAPAQPNTPAASTAPIAAEAESVSSQTSVNDNTVAIVAPMIGCFYAKPSPGAAPFVSVGTAVDEDATVALIEVMKVFNAVRAGIAGTVTEVCVKDGQFIEFGQVLFRVLPSAGSAGRISTASANVQEGTDS